MLAGLGELLRRRVPLPQTPIWRVAGGVLSGFFGGLVGNQGGIRAAALLGFQLRPRQIVATATAAALLVDAARVPIYILSTGRLMTERATLALAITIGVSIGTFIGVPILSRIPDTLYRRMLGGLLVLLAIGLFTAIR
jgi:uncharacterized membrane protein YfcA